MIDLHAGLTAIDATWPAERFDTCGPFTLRFSSGGGQRVTCATANAPARDADILAAETAMQAMGQTPLFMLLPSDAALDAQLEARGYVMHDPVVMRACPVGHLTDLTPPRVTIFDIPDPLAIMREIWAEGGIGPERLAIMARSKGPKTGLLARRTDQPAGVAFVACDGPVAMVHAVEIRPAHRRNGMGAWLMRGAALWAEKQRAEWLTVLCTRANAPANALYASLGMDPVGGYHYRVKPKD